MTDSESNSGDSGAHHTVFQGLRVSLTPAPFIKRFLAYCVDMGVVLAIMYPLIILGAIGFAFVVGVGEALVSGVGGALGIVIAIIGLLLILSLQNVYFIVQEKRTGTTLGKKIFGIRVVSLDGAPLTVGQAILRDLMRYIDCALIFPGLFSVFLSSRRRRLGDLMAGTIVVHSAAREQSRNFMYLSSDEYARLEATLQPKELPLNLGEEVKKFAFKAYVTGGEIDHEIERGLVEELNPYVGESSSLKEVSSESLVRFFAERCLQEQYR